MSAWEGYAFEQVCLHHIDHIKQALGIAGVAGSGQREILEAIAGLTPVESGEIDYFPPDHEAQELTKLSGDDFKI